MNELWINEQTAQLILDALAWCNEDWQDALAWQMSDKEKITRAREDFVRFCKARGIAGVEKKVNIE